MQIKTIKIIFQYLQGPIAGGFSNKKPSISWRNLWKFSNKMSRFYADAKSHDAKICNDGPINLKDITCHKIVK